MATKGTALKGALATAPRGGRVTSLPVAKVPAGVMAGVGAGLNKPNLQRVSPGVYRNPQGQLVKSTTGNLPSQQPQKPPFQAMPARTVAPQQPMQYPQMQPGMMYAGGSPNFNEATGQYNQQFMTGMGAGFGSAFGQQGQMNQPAYDTGFYDYMKAKAAAVQPLSPEQQAAQMAQQQANAQAYAQQAVPQTALQTPFSKGSIY